MDWFLVIQVSSNGSHSIRTCGLQSSIRTLEIQKGKKAWPNLVGLNREKKVFPKTNKKAFWEMKNTLPSFKFESSTIH